MLGLGHMESQSFHHRGTQTSSRLSLEQDSAPVVELVAAPELREENEQAVVVSLDREAGETSYAQRVQDMAMMIRQVSEKSGHWDGVETAWSHYVINESDTVMQQFSEAMLRAEYQVANNDILEVYKSRKLAGETLTDEEKDHEWQAKCSKIEGNHFLRTMLSDQRDNFTIKEVSAWYAKFGGDRMKTAEGDVMGAYSEIAVYEAAATMPGLLDAVRYGEIADDARGGDIMGVSAVDLGTVYIDVKAGMQPPVGKLSKHGYHLTIGVPTQMMDKHGHMDPDGIQGIQRLLALSMQQTAAAGRKHA